MILESFPDYDLSTLPPIPSDWQDVSYRNDTCPSWLVNGLQIYIDYEKAEDRDFDTEKRFHVLGNGSSVDLLSTDDWSEVLNFVHLSGLKLPQIKHDQTEEQLCLVYNEFLAITGLPAYSAEDLILHLLPSNVRSWLSRFIIIWEEMEEEQRDWDKYAAQKTGTRRV